MKTTFISFFIIVLFFLGCKKDETDNKSYALKLLQNRWTPTSCRIYFPNGDSYKLIPAISKTFTSNGKLKVENYITTSTATIIEEEVIASYNLLPDDTTIIFYYVNNGIQNINADTSFISSLTDDLLVYYYKKNSMLSILDSLKR